LQHWKFRVKQRKLSSAALVHWGAYLLASAMMLWCEAIPLARQERVRGAARDAARYCLNEMAALQQSQKLPPPAPGVILENITGKSNDSVDRHFQSRSLASTPSPTPIVVTVELSPDRLPTSLSQASSPITVQPTEQVAELEHLSPSSHASASPLSPRVPRRRTIHPSSPSYSSSPLSVDRQSQLFTPNPPQLMFTPKPFELPVISLPADAFECTTSSRLMAADSRLAQQALSISPPNGRFDASALMAPMTGAASQPILRQSPQSPHQGQTDVLGMLHAAR
jgi:hypothetical protein